MPSLPGSGFLWRVGSLGALGAGAYLLATAGDVSLAILFLVAGLATSGVLMGAGRHGYAAEGVLDLSARLGLGLLGGILGGVAVVLVRWALESFGIADATNVSLASIWGGATLLAHLGSAAVWGLVLGVLYPQIPGLPGAGRGVSFSLFPSAFVLLWVYPTGGLGVFGSQLGALTFVYVIGLNVLWGALTASAIGWGQTTEEAPVARPIAE